MIMRPLSVRRKSRRRHGGRSVCAILCLEVPDGVVICDRDVVSQPRAFEEGGL